MALKDDFNTSISNLNTTAQQVITAFQQLKTTAGSVDDATVQAGISAINSVTSSLNALVTPPTPPTP